MMCLHFRFEQALRQWKFPLPQNILWYADSFCFVSFRRVCKDSKKCCTMFQVSFLRDIIFFKNLLCFTFLLSTCLECHLLGHRKIIKDYIKKLNINKYSQSYLFLVLYEIHLHFLTRFSVSKVRISLGHITQTVGYDTVTWSLRANKMLYFNATVYGFYRHWLREPSGLRRNI